MLNLSKLYSNANANEEDTLMAVGDGKFVCEREVVDDTCNSIAGEERCLARKAVRLLLACVSKEISPMRLLSVPFPAIFFSASPLGSSKPSPPFQFASLGNPLPRRAFHFSLSHSISSSLKTNSCKPSPAAWQRPVYVYPDPIPEFAKAETRKFEGELRKKLLKSKDVFEGDVDVIVELCTEIFSDFLHKEYGGPGTLLLEPFTDMLLTLKEKKLPGAPAAARAALSWAQNYVDRDWEIWHCQQSQ
ncbi:hypothetical protein Cni_G00741 [Canna indica]|uniref:Protein PLASTID REDOX INSENSITIVE 2 n=1 Tax=Canna indica TaxID=4628 RepID=A0AAQ3Q000_9LILI|nr:hypothetical protein Cni_G00741 [Canna indica]